MHHRGAGLRLWQCRIILWAANPRRYGDDNTAGYDQSVAGDIVYMYVYSKPDR